MAIPSLISKIELLSQSRDVLPYNKEKLISSLNELDELVGIEAAKDMIVIELERIIYCLLISKVELKPHMFHTLIYGPSGCGKTTLAKILSKIWKATNILKDIENHVIIITEDEIREIISRFSLLYSSHFNKTRTYLEENTWKTLKEKLDSLVQSPRVKVFDDSNITIAGRDSFVAEYSGQTSTKTLKFLEQNRGKCIIIEEAYSLFSGTNDNYGAEALTIINRWMEEKSQENIFIFVGYKDEMINSVFKTQPGLKRRFLWVFDIEGYTPEDLASIFTFQCKKCDLNLSSEIDLIDFFRTYYEMFPHFGGDTLRLSHACETVYYSKAFEALCGETTIMNEINREILMEAFSNYSKNLVR